MKIMSQFVDMSSAVLFFDVILFPLSSLVTGQYHHWFWSYDNLLLEGIDQKFEYQKHLRLRLPNIWRLEWVRDTKFGTDLSNEMLLNATKCQGYRLYRFSILRKNQQWGKNTGLKLTIETIEEFVETQLKLTIKTQKLRQ